MSPSSRSRGVRGPGGGGIRLLHLFKFPDDLRVLLQQPRKFLLSAFRNPLPKRTRYSVIYFVTKLGRINFDRNVSSVIFIESNALLIKYKLF